MHNQIKVSVIVVNYNSWAPMESLFKTLLLQTGVEMEIVVVDNASTVAQPANAFAILEKAVFDYQYIENKHNSGFAAACNIGAAAAQGDYLLFCNPDIEIPNNDLEKIIDIYQNNDVQVLSCRQKNSSNQIKEVGGNFPTLARFTPIIGGFFKQQNAKNNELLLRPVDWVSGSVVLISRNNFDLLSGWDASFFMYMEDVDLCRRAKKLNMKVAVCNDIIWVHHHGLSSKHHLSDRVRSKSAAIISKHQYVKKHFNHFQKPLAHTFIFLKYGPELIIGGLLSVLIPAKELIVRRRILRQYLQHLIK